MFGRLFCWLVIVYVSLYWSRSSTIIFFFSIVRPSFGLSNHQLVAVAPMCETTMFHLWFLHVMRIVSTVTHSCHGNLRYPFLNCINIDVENRQIISSVGHFSRLSASLSIFQQEHGSQDRLLQKAADSFAWHLETRPKRLRCWANFHFFHRRISWESVVLQGILGYFVVQNSWDVAVHCISYRCLSWFIHAHDGSVCMPKKW